EGDSDKMDAIEARPQVNVSYASDSGWVSLSGVARREDDRDLLESLWSPATSAFGAGGKDDPNTTLLVVSAETAAYWESPGKGEMVVELVKGVATYRPARTCDTGTVEL